MKVLGRTLIEEFYAKHADARGPLLAWYQEAVAAQWRTPHDVKQRYPSASPLGDGRVIFNVKGNRYRLEAVIAYQAGTVVIRRVGTHAEYDTWD